MLQEGRERHAANLILSSEKILTPKTLESTFRGLLGPYGIFFSGVGPGVTWISIGGFVFFGAYEKAKQVLVFAI